MFLQAFLVLIFSVSAWASARLPQYDTAVCEPTIKEKHFLRGDTILWENRVVKELDAVVNDPGFNKGAIENLKSKNQLAAVGFDENKISQQTRTRIVSEASRDPNGFKNALTTRLYCTKNFIEKELPDEVKGTIECLQPENQPKCGKDFQGTANIQKNLNVLRNIDTKINAILGKTYSDEVKREYVEDIEGSYSDLSRRIKEALANGEKSIEAARLKAIKDTQDKYDADSKKLKSLESSEKVFTQCKTYLKTNDHDDKRGILPQLSDCNLPGSPAENQNINSMLKSIEAIKGKVQQKEMHNLGIQFFDKTKEHTGKSYLMSYFRIHGKLPPESEFMAKVGEKKKNSDAWRAAQEAIKSQTPMNIDGEMATFNSGISNLNKICSGAKTMNGTKEQKVAIITMAYQQFLKSSPFGALMTLDKIKDKVGTFDGEDCVKKGVGVKTLKPEDKPSVVAALEESLTIIADKGKELNSNEAKLTNPDDPNKGIRYFLKYNPLVIREMLRTKVTPEQAALLCFEINRIYDYEDDNAFWSKALTVASIAGSIVATCITGGAAAPLLYASLTLGVANSAVAIDNALTEEDRYQEADMTETVDRTTAQALVAEYKTEAKIETVGLALQFVPGAGKMLSKGLKVVVAPAMKTTMVQALKTGTTSVWGKVVKLSAPATEYFGKAAASTGAKLADLQLALARTVGPKADQAMVKLFNTLAADLPQNVALELGAMALTFPDPPGVFSKEGMEQLLESVLKGQLIQGMTSSAASTIKSRMKTHGLKLDESAIGLTEADALIKKAKIKEVPKTEPLVIEPKKIKEKAEIGDPGLVTASNNTDAGFYEDYQRLSAKVKGEEIGMLSYDIHDNQLQIGWSKVKKEFQGKGYQSDMFEQLFVKEGDKTFVKKYDPVTHKVSLEEVKSIRTSLDGTNQSTFENTVVKEIQSKMKAENIAPPVVDEAVIAKLRRKQERQLNNNVEEGMMTREQADALMLKPSSEEDLYRCCGSYLSSMSEIDKRKLFDDALKDTPAWKTRKKYGFDELGDRNYNFKQNKDGTVNLKVEFDALPSQNKQVKEVKTEIETPKEDLPVVKPVSQTKEIEVIPAVKNELIVEPLKNSNPSYEPSGPQKMPLSAADYKKAEVEYRAYDEKFPVLGHIKGEFEYMQKDNFTPQAKIKSGVHTVEGVEFLKKIRPDLANKISYRELPNGVIIADIPEGAFYTYKFNYLSKSNIFNKTIDGQEVRFTTKGLFPKKWNDAEVLSAINNVKNNKASLTTVSKDVQIVRGKYQDVMIELRVKDGEVLTAFPVID